MAQGPQKPDHGGNFIMLPRRVMDSVAWRHASHRAQAVLLALMYRHTGFNNGEIGISIHDIGAFLGNQNHKANSLAVAELIEKGFVECTSDANRHQSKVRTYRITFISTGQGKSSAAATHEYADWRPPAGKTRQFGLAKATTQNPVSVAETTTPRKFSVAEITTPTTETRGLEAPLCVVETARLIVNHISGSEGQSAPSGISSPHSSINGAKSGRADSAGVDLAELRDWYKATVDHLGYGGQRVLAQDSGVPDCALSKFKSGKGLPEGYRMPLQLACARALPHDKWRAAA